MIVGNKKDLEQDRVVTKEESESFSKKHNLFFLETSALDNSDQMIEKVFLNLCEALLKIREGESDDESVYEVRKKIDISKRPQE